MAKHRLGERRQDDRALRRTVATVQLVDTTDTAHRVTLDAATDGLSRGRYTTLCGGDVLPAALVTREARHCRLCSPIPAPRSR
jgi:hypothetical protein